MPPLNNNETATIRVIALSKIQHLFTNIDVSKRVLTELNYKTVSMVRHWIGLNSQQETSCPTGPEKDDWGSLT